MSWFKLIIMHIKCYRLFTRYHVDIRRRAVELDTKSHRLVMKYNVYGYMFIVHFGILFATNKITKVELLHIMRIMCHIFSIDFSIAIDVLVLINNNTTKDNIDVVLHGNESELLVVYDEFGIAPLIIGAYYYAIEHDVCVLGIVAEMLTFIDTKELG